jgi:hypothetical protein
LLAVVVVVVVVVSVQAWIAVIADKLEVSLEGFTVSGTGFKGSSSSSSSKAKSKASKA